MFTYSRLTEDMTSILTSHSYVWPAGAKKSNGRGRINKGVSQGCRCPSVASGSSFSQNQDLGFVRHFRRVRMHRFACLSSVKDFNADNSEDENSEDESSSSGSESKGESNNSFRENLERIVGKDDSAFSGLDLATLIRRKYGRSYDVQLIKKEFMGRNLLALNVMWKYVEQKSFPLTEEEYILRLDDVANNLRCWGAVSHIRNSLANSKERPRIGKAVSIFIDMDESGGRSDEWIYK